ncbi:tribbles homolog 2-like [Chanos chanos]|uniref:Tribbles homolog 2-like n=1 Tax=Chanos chanos TaxID=29144 RepID=A0A6J2V9J7_CHACN|nr:tribbles homolog 2-like [Chanos chanos]
MVLTSRKLLRHPHLTCVGNYILFGPIVDDIVRAKNVLTDRGFLCKMLHTTQYLKTLAVHFHLPAHHNLNQVADIVPSDTLAYVFFEQNYGDLHTYVRTLQKVQEDEAARLFKQIVSVVAHCHDNGVILQDLKLKKFVFCDVERTILKLDSFEDAHIMGKNDDFVSGKHGCPAYTCPESLQADGMYSGKASNVWSLGIMLYTVLIGHYPFNDTALGILFSKIQQCKFSLPNTVSPEAACLIRSVLRLDPLERLTAKEILDHPWFYSARDGENLGGSPSCKKNFDQVVPDPFR